MTIGSNEGYLIDTNTVFRRYLPDDPYHTVAHQGIGALLRRDETLFVTPQNLLEVHALVTRPVAANGMGMSPLEARELCSLIESDFHMLPETPEIYPLWKNLVDRYSVIGRQVYDSRLVAVMLAHGVDHLLTLNPAHFRRFTEITVHTPEEIVNAP
jgi:predicted nucleic acid-binding protein